MAKKPQKSVDYVTILERNPAYLRAIGTVAVEIINLEMMLGDLMAAITRLPPDTADAIYWAPMAMGPRLAIVLGAAREALKERAALRKKVERFLEKARALGNRRNDVMHNAWGLDRVENKFQTQQMPSTRHDPRPITLTEIENLVYQIRILAGDVIELTDQLWGDRTYTPSLGRYPPPSSLQNQNIPQEGSAVKRRSPKRSPQV